LAASEQCRLRAALLLAAVFLFGFYVVLTIPAGPSRPMRAGSSLPASTKNSGAHKQSAQDAMKRAKPGAAIQTERPA